MIYSFSELPSHHFALAGGKGRVLAQLAQARYPVPDGLVVLPSAFEDNVLTSAAWTRTQTLLGALRSRNGQTAFAVRSSALSEDSAQASFAGEFETVLDVKSDAEIRAAIEQVRRSRQSERVHAYSVAQGLHSQHEMAVVVQRLVRAEFSGVLFTADPVTGSRATLTGNFIQGLGEALVSGEQTAQTFTLTRPNGKYSGPPELRRYARALYQLASRLEDGLSSPQDIEFAIADGQVHLLQARPITTLRAHNPRTGEWNDSLTGDYLWTNSNFGEALPDVMTPLTWSLIQAFQAVSLPITIPGGHPMMGNIGGRFYLNMSLPASIFIVLGMNRARLKYESEEFFGNLSDDTEVPIIPFGRWKMLKIFLPYAFGAIRRVRRNRERLPEYVAAFPMRCEALRARIQRATSTADLLAVYQELDATYREALVMLQAGTSGYENAYRPLRHKLRKLMGEADANTLLTGLSEGANYLASLGPLIGLTRVVRGEITPAEYARTFGHRGPHEFEVSWPRPAEDPAWVEQQARDLQTSDVDALLAKQQAQRDAAWGRFTARYPGQAATLQKQLAHAAVAARSREAIRSEVVRLMWVWREFALRAGAVTGLGQAIFFLAAAEIAAVLQGDSSSAAHIPARCETHARYSALPQYPTLIRGRFDPFAWAKDPNRRGDRFDANQKDLTGFGNLSGLIRGFPGAMGVVEGIVRRLDTPEEGHHLQPGEILVTTTTNVGWTPLFPRAAAIVTDVGAPLSHAAIVARELGLPAVVGCGDATLRLKTGDRVRVNGGQGTVEMINPPTPPPQSPSAT